MRGLCSDFDQCFVSVAMVTGGSPLQQSAANPVPVPVVVNNMTPPQQEPKKSAGDNRRVSFDYDFSSLSYLYLGT